MKVIIITLIALVVLGTGVLIGGRVGAAPAASGQPTYTVAQAVVGIELHPNTWRGRVVRVRGLVHVGLVGVDRPVAVLADAPRAAIHTAPIDIGPLLERLRGTPSGGRPAMLLLTQKPTSRQRLDEQRAKVYLLRLGTASWEGHQVPSGEIV